MRDQQTRVDPGNRAERRETIERRSRTNGELKEQPWHRLFPRVQDEGEHGMPLGSESDLDLARVIAGVGELAARHVLQPMTVIVALNESDQQREELPAVVLLLGLNVSAPVVVMSARR